MIRPTFDFDDREFQRNLRRYLDLRGNTDPVKELRRRAKNVGYSLVGLYNKNATKKEAITAKVRSLGGRVKIRPRIKDAAKNQGLSRKALIAKELRARVAATSLTTTGWFPPIKALGGTITRKSRRRVRGEAKGKLVEKTNGADIHETLINEMPGAAVVAAKDPQLFQKAIDKEAADMARYILRRQDQAARRNNL